MKAAVLEELRAEWFEDAVATIRSLAADHAEITADDLRANMRPPASDKWPGLAFGLARRAGIIEAIDTTTSKARSRNHGSLRVWAAVKEEGKQS